MKFTISKISRHEKEGNVICNNQPRIDAYIRIGRQGHEKTYYNCILYVQKVEV